MFIESEMGPREWVRSDNNPDLPLFPKGPAFDRELTKELIDALGLDLNWLWFVGVENLPRFVECRIWNPNASSCPAADASQVARNLTDRCDCRCVLW